MSKLPVALQLYSIRREVERDFEGSLKKVREMGYDGIELAGLFGIDPIEIKSWCEDLKLNPIAAHVNLPELREDMEKTLADYKTIGCKYIVIPYLHEQYLPDHDEYSDFVAFTKRLGKRVQKLGMILLYHNHEFELETLKGEHMLDIIYKDIGPEFMETEIDPCWVNVGGVNPAEYICRYKNRSPVVQLKDFIGRRKAETFALKSVGEDKKQLADAPFEFRALGQGLLDVPAVLKAAREAGATWLIIEQDEPKAGNSAMEDAKASIDYLKNVAVD